MNPFLVRVGLGFSFLSLLEVDFLGCLDMLSMVSPPVDLPTTVCTQ